MIVTNENEIIVDAKRRRAPIIMSIHLSVNFMVHIMVVGLARVE